MRQKLRAEICSWASNDLAHSRCSLSIPCDWISPQARRLRAAHPWGLETQHRPECFSAELSSLGKPPSPSSVWEAAFISRGASGQRAAEPNGAGLMQCLQSAGRHDGRKMEAPIPGGGRYPGETPSGLPHLRHPGCSLLREAQGPLGKGKIHLCSLFHLYLCPQRFYLQLQHWPCWRGRRCSGGRPGGGQGECRWWQSGGHGPSHGHPAFSGRGCVLPRLPLDRPNKVA